MGITTKLTGSKVVVLGGTSGIGLATAKGAALEGASVIVASSRQASVDRALLQLPSGTEGYALDLSQEEQVKALFTRIGEFDHLVFTAGESLLLSEIGAVDISTAKQAFNLRYWGAYMAAKYGSANIKPGGSITLTTGIAEDRPQKSWTVATSICGATSSLTRALAVELAPVRVNAVKPGVVKTDLWSNMTEEEREGMYKASENALPAGLVGEAGDLAEAYLFLMRERYMTGQLITVDGGAVLV